MSIPYEPGFADDVCFFKYPSDPEVDKERNVYNEKLKNARDQSIERIQEDVQRYETLFFGIFYHLTRISFEYKKLSDDIMKEAKDFKKLPPYVLQSFLNTVHCSIKQCDRKLKPTQNVGLEGFSNENATSGEESKESDIEENFEMLSAAEEETDDFEKLLADPEHAALMKEYARKEEQLNDDIKQKNADMAEEKKQQDLQEEVETKERERNLKELEDELREEKERADKIFEENLKEMRRKREEFEKETERMRLEDIKEMHQRIAAFWKCVQLKLDWEMKEEEWADWLKVIRQPVARSINQFASFTDSIYPQEDSDPKVDCMHKEELFQLHYQTRSTYDFLHDTYLKIKDLHEQFPERKFLLILLKQISKVCHVVLDILHMIDDAEANRVNEELVKSLKELFSKIDSWDIPYTFQLRSEEKTFNSGGDDKIEDPEKYEPKSSVIISEVGDQVEKDEGEIGRGEQSPEISEKTEKTNTTETKIQHPGQESESESSVGEVEDPNDKKSDEIKKDEAVDSENRTPDEIKSDENPENPTPEIEGNPENTNTKNNH